MTALAAVEEYLKILQDTDYAIWYWNDRRDVLTALELVMEVLSKTDRADADECTCVSHSDT